MADPREVLNEINLTSDSDDELADLEKEFAVKKQKLIEERERKKAESRNHVDVQRSPSPPRRQPQTEYFQKLLEESERKRPKISESQKEPRGLFSTSTTRKPTNNASTEFATRLAGIEGNSVNGDLSERLFEFEEIPRNNVQPAKEGEKDEITGFELKNRMAPAETIRQLLNGIKALVVLKLLAKIIPPRFEEPSYVNWCFVGMVVFKSMPKTTVNGEKFLQLRVGDFAHSVDVMLFGKAFDLYWKLQPGEIIAILNPQVKKFLGLFNLRLNEELYSILEIGLAKHFGYCSSNTKSGSQCKHVVNTLEATLCEFHLESKYLANVHRMELHGAVTAKRPKPKKSGGSDWESKWEKSMKSREKWMKKNGIKEREPWDENFVDKLRFAREQELGYHGTVRNEVYEGGVGFDSSRFDLPVSKPRKEARRIASNQRLEEHLMANVAPARAKELQKLGILRGNRGVGSPGPESNDKDGDKGVEQKKQAEQKDGEGSEQGPDQASQHKEGPHKPGLNDTTAFTTKSLSGLRKLAASMGFDPTAQSAPRTASKTSWAQELQELSKKKTISLEPSREEKKRKMAQWKKNASFVTGSQMAQLGLFSKVSGQQARGTQASAGVAEAKAGPNDNTGSKKITGEKISKQLKKPPPPPPQDSDDDDLEIAFATTAQHKGYCGLLTIVRRPNGGSGTKPHENAEPTHHE